MDKISKQTILPNYSSDSERRQEFIKLGWWVSIPLSVVPVHWLNKNEQRIDAGYYTQDVIASNRLVHDCGYEVSLLKEITSEIFVLGRFKRIYTSDSSRGWPYLSPSDAFDFRPFTEKFIAPDHAPKAAKRHFSKEGWILISASGSVGRVLYTTKRLEKYFLSHDLIRVVPKNNFPIGYIYAYLSTWVGQALIIKDQYGSAIKHLEPHHIAEIPIPNLPHEDQVITHDKIINAYELREKANSLLDDAADLFYSSLGLRAYPLSEVPYLPLPLDTQYHSHPIPNPQAFTVKSSSLANRLDASYHVPTALLARQILSKLQVPYGTIGDLVKDIFLPNRFKRVYVKKEYGIPFLQGSHLPQNILYDLKYISSRANEKNINQCLIHQGYVLVTRSGTIGITSFVSSFREGWVASEHILRIAADNNKADPGYIALFLMTPYGQHQVKSKIYGGVVDEITADDLKSVVIPIPSIETQNKIGKLVAKAFEIKDLATKIEMEAINELENKLAPKSTEL